MPHCPAWEGAPVAPAVYHAYAMQGRRKSETCLAGDQGASDLAGEGTGSRYLSGGMRMRGPALSRIQPGNVGADAAGPLNWKEAAQWEEFRQ